MSGTYQSRVFTFISNRTNRLKDTCSKGWRHLKVAVVWSSQILLYPIHLLAQTTKILPPQISPRSTIQPVSDINIEQALNLVAGIGDPMEIAASRYRSPQLTAPKPIIRGLSSLLIDRQLVLVTTENQILDILTLSQQQEIRRRIGFDLATSWHQWQTGQLPDNHSPSLLTGIADRVRDSSSLSLFDRWQNWWQKIKTKTPSIPPASISTSEPIYPPQLPPNHYSFKPKPPQINRFFELPQLPPLKESLSQSIVANQSISSIEDTIVKLQPDWLKQWWNYYREYLYIPSKSDRQIVHQPEEFKLIPIESASKQITVKKQNAIHRKEIVKAKNLDRSIQNNLSIRAEIEDRDLEYSQDWIEAESEVMGYSKTPLAKILAWLDRVVLQIENWLIKIWHAITIDRARN
jgi:hypothetical protein